ncbi:MAG: sensor histidine kinase [Ruthenibacterium sp.]
MPANEPHHFMRRIISQLRKLNLYPRLLLMFCCLLIASTAFITWFNQATYARDLEDSAVRYRSAMVQNAMFKLQQQKESIEQNITGFFQNETVLQALHENQIFNAQNDRFDTSVSELIQNNRRIVENALLSTTKKSAGIRALILIANAEQYSVSSSSDAAGGPMVRNLKSLYQSEIYQGAIREKGYPFWRDSVKETSALFFENETSKVGIMGCATLAYQIFEPRSRKPLGVLICCVSPQYFTNALREYSTQDGGNTFIIGENGLLEGIEAGLSAPPFPQPWSTLRKQIFSRPQGEFTFETGNEDLLVSFCGDSSFPIRVVNLTYRNWVLRPAVRLGQTNGLILLAIILVGVFGFYITTMSIVYPIKHLIGTMQRVGDGDLNAVYKAVSHDEIGTLCREFDRMVSDMKKLIDQVYVAETREKQLELAEKSAQLDALQMQVNPHFLYNTLDLIRWECLNENDGESLASDMIEKFCALLRMTIKGSHKTERIADSLLHAVTYLEIVNFRYTNKILLCTELNFEANDYEIPCLSLQPILENAVRHGFENQNTADRRITIQGLLQEDDTLVFRVSDNGCGIDEAQLTSLRQSLEDSKMEKTNIGLRNVNQRCKLCYGERFGIQIESSAGVGTTVQLTIPAKKAAETGGVEIV